MMLYQQTMLNSTFEPIANRPSLTSSSNSKNGSKGRTVNFSSSTKKEESSSQNQQQQQQQHQQQSGVKRSHSHYSHRRQQRQSSNAVPIPQSMFRTLSEEQLTVDEQMADERDFIFYARLMNGISERRASSGTDRRFNRYNEETDRCLTHIIQTRHHNIQEQQQGGGGDGGVLIEEQEDQNHHSQNNNGGGGYYLDKDNECFTTYSSASSSSSSSSSCSSSTYQQDFDQHNDNNDIDLYEGDNECIFDLEL
jgi:hypothetical protein